MDGRNSAPPRKLWETIVWLVFTRESDFWILSISMVPEANLGWRKPGLDPAGPSFVVDFQAMLLTVQVDFFRGFDWWFRDSESLGVSMGNSPLYQTKATHPLGMFLTFAFGSHPRNTRTSNSELEAPSIFFWRVSPPLLGLVFFFKTNGVTMEDDDGRRRKTRTSLVGAP